MFTKLTNLFLTAHKHVTNFVGAIQQPKPVDLDSVKYLYPYGLPKYNNPNIIVIPRAGYVVGYDTNAKIPSWVCYTLTPEHSIGKLPRSNAFTPDFSLSENQRATLEDYEKVDFDRGHNCPDDDQNWDKDLERQSFILSNVTPQNKDLNRGRWKVLETYVRAWAHELNHTLNIITGPIYDSTCETIGKSKVVVPSGYYKIVIDTVTNQSLSFYFTNDNQAEDDPAKYQVTTYGSYIN